MRLCRHEMLPSWRLGLHYNQSKVEINMCGYIKICSGQERDHKLITMSEHLARCGQEGAAYAHTDIANGRLATTRSMQPPRLSTVWRQIGEAHDE